MKTHRDNPGFTLLEMMIVVATIGLLASLALPSFLESRLTTHNTRFITDLRTAAGAFDQRAIEAGDFPPDAGPGVVPPGMQDYLAHFAWDQPTPIGGNWRWERDALGDTIGIVVTAPTASPARMAHIDGKIDDGDLVTGAFRRKLDGSGYIYRSGT